MIKRKILYNNVPKNKKNYKWNDSVGCYLDFEYGDCKGRILIKERIKPDKLRIEYNGKEKILNQYNLLSLQIGDLLGFITFDFKYDIGYEFGKSNNKMVIIDRYKKEGKKYRAKCLKCSYEKELKESRVKRNEGCPVCLNQKIIKGVNDMWTTNPELAILLVDQNDGYKYSKSSSKKLKWRCPHCNLETKLLSPDYILKYGLHCTRCSDGFSYPNKFIFNLLSELHVNFTPEKIFSWSEHKIYDFYLPDYNCIIEAHGMQHYKDCYFTNYKNVNQNDIIKRNLAIDNGIDKYIVIDCRFSKPEYIFKNICESNLRDMIKLDGIDINYIDMLCQKNILLEIADMYNNNYNTDKIKELTKISKSQICRLLNKADYLRLIEYDNQKYKKETVEKAQITLYQNNAKPIKCLENGYVFGTPTILANNSLNVFGKKISVGSVCNAVNHNKTIFGLKLIHITRKEFNDIKLSSPNKAYGDFFNSLKDGNEVA